MTLYDYVHSLFFMSCDSGPFAKPKKRERNAACLVSSGFGVTSSTSEPELQVEAVSMAMGGPEKWMV